MGITTTYLPIVKIPPDNIKFEKNELYKLTSTRNYDKNKAEMERGRKHTVLYKSILESKLNEYETMTRITKEIIEKYKRGKEKIKKNKKAIKNIIENYKPELIVAQLRGNRMKDKTKKTKTLEEYMGKPKVTELYENIKKKGKKKIKDIEKRYDMEEMNKMIEEERQKKEEKEEEKIKEIKEKITKTCEKTEDIQKEFKRAAKEIEEEIKRATQEQDMEGVMDLDNMRAIRMMNQTQEEQKKQLKTLKELYEKMNKKTKKAKETYMIIIQQKGKIEELERELETTQIMKDIVNIQRAKHSENILREVIREKTRREAVKRAEERARRQFEKQAPTSVKNDEYIIEIQNMVNMKTTMFNDLYAFN